ncbi:MAG: hypothetical protein DRI46_10255 [Chloroflexi bacterium]|nr:MAG: hypothetical protein DRI46_10255 [Chloroflexota bacterium]
MFELEVNHERLSAEDIPEDILNHFSAPTDNILAIALIPWEEHCTECAMPLCYETCDLYEPRKDGKCRRFIGGIRPVHHINGIQNYIVSISFKQWGQLMAYANMYAIPKMRAQYVEKLIYAIDGISSRIPDKNISIRGRQSLSTRLTRRLKQSIAGTGLFKRQESNNPDYFLIEVYNPNPFDVHLSLNINNIDQSQYNIGYQKLLKLSEGFTKYKIGIDEIHCRVDTNQKFGISLNPNILDKKDEGLCLYFGLITFVWDSDLISIRANKEKPYIKVVAWDLDNTVWDGILIEDGTDNITLKPGIIDIFKKLDERGILNTVASKNNPDDTLKFLKAIGLSDYIINPKIGWDQKGQYIKSLVNQFNVGENTFAFIDDSPFERDEVKSLNPEIRVYDAALYNTLLELPEFNPPVSIDSTHRRKYYQNEIDRGEAQSSFDGEYLSFLKNCNIQLNIYTPTKNNIDRIQELVQRTNQLNFSGNRYERDKIEKILFDSHYDVFCLDCEDKYGQYGTVGFAIIDTQTLQLSDMMFSCRVQSKRVEHAFLSFLLSHYKKQGHKSFSALFNKTDRNTKAGAVFSDLDFKETSNTNSLIIYGYNLENTIPSDGVIRILWNDKEWQI